MRAWLLVGCMTAAVFVGCAGTNGGGTTHGGDASTGDDGGSGDDAGADAAADKLTWTYIYGTYFGAATPGHCGNAGCHSFSRGGFLCASKANCYTSITANNSSVGGRMVNVATPGQSVLLDAANSPVSWFSASGNMPQDALTKNATAATEIAAWINAGAPNN